MKKEKKVLRTQPAARHCKFYRLDKRELVENGHKDTLLFIYMDDII